MIRKCFSRQRCPAGRCRKVGGQRGRCSSRTTLKMSLGQVDKARSNVGMELVLTKLWLLEQFVLTVLGARPQCI